MKNLNGFIFLFLAYASEAFGGTIRHDVPDEKYLDYGNKYECVLRINGILEEEDKIIKYHGSCIAISNRWIITAAHVVEGSKRNIVIFEEKEIPIIKSVIHKDFKRGNFGSIDLALCKLDKELNLKFYPELYHENNEIGKICGIAGYGKTGDGVIGANKVDDKKRGGSNKIFAISDYSLYCIMSKSTPTELEFLISHGDSGGGLFIDGKLAGVNSCVFSSDGKADSSYGDESCHIRVSKQIEWIKKILDEN